ncbi:MAG: ATP-binding protein [Proteobacteria bacterium]|nr:ATP-binding protein [Pseudomonadota bacterium]
MAMSLATKLRVIIIGIAGSLLLVSIAGSVSYVTYRSYFANIDESSVQMEQVVASLGTAVNLRNSASIARQLEGLLSIPHLQGALVISPENAIIAAVGDSQEIEQAMTRSLPLTEIDTLSGWQRTWLITPVDESNSTVATLIAVINHEEVLGVIFQQLVAGAIIMLLLMIAVIPLSRSLARYLSAPIDSLKTTVATVTEQQDFSLRAEKVSDDEIGFLVERFNELLQQLEERERKLCEYSNSLESSVAELEAAKNEAEKAAIMKTQFLANMSHEIRTPMNGVVGMLDLLRGCVLSSEQRDYVEIASRSATGLLSIINDILDLSKIDAGKMTLAPEAMAPGDVVEEVIAIMYQVARRKEVELCSVIDPKAFDTFELDPTRLRQVLLNLVGNAVKFTHEGHILVRCEVAQQRDTQKLEFYVKDTGIGIDANNQHALFEAFGQADGSTTRKYGGTGLGLAISRQVVSLMGGEIGFVSQTGCGSEFYFSIPAVNAEDQYHAYTRVGLEDLRVAIRVASPLQHTAIERLLQRMQVTLTSSENEVADVVITDEQDFQYEKGRLIRLVHHVTHTSKSHETAELILPIRFKQLRNALKQIPQADVHGPALAKIPTMAARVLLVEDNAVNQIVADKMLRKFGIECEKAEDGLEAIQKIAENKYDLIFMDCHMPRMDGYEATIEIRKYQEQRGSRPTPIIALTANAMEEDEKRCIDAGMDDYLAKPIESESMGRALQRWLGESQSASLQ